MSGAGIQAMKTGWLVGAAALAAFGITAQAAPHTAKHAAKHTAIAPTNDDGVPLSQETEHVVKAGETLMGVATRAKVPRVIIIEANGLKKPYEVHAGQHLLLPRTRHHTVKAGESGFDIAIRYGVPWSAVAIANGLDADAPVKPGQKLLIPSVLSHGTIKSTGKSADTPSASPSASASTSAIRAAAGKAASAASDAESDDTGESGPAPKFQWPVKGKVRRGFVPRAEGDYHDGIDIAAARGTAVRAAADGEVIFAAREPANYGRLVVIDHGHGWQSAYGFLDKITVKQGDHVKATERVGLLGHSGKAKGDEVHFELRRANHQVDPEHYLARGKKPAKADTNAPTHKKKRKKTPEAD